MIIYLDEKLKTHFPHQNTFDYIMALRGKVFRELENRRTQYIKIADKGYFLKQHFGIGWKEIFKNLLQGRLPILGATPEWEAARKLQALNIPTLSVVGFGKHKVNPAKQHSFLLTEELSSSISLEDYCRDWNTKPPTFKHKHELIITLAKIMRVMHEAGINHRDCYICHFLLDTSKTFPQLHVIDLHRAQIRKHTPARWLIKDLAGLYFSSKDIGLTTRDILRFMKYYKDQPLRTVLQDFKNKNFWQKVKKRGDKLYRQNGSK